MFCGRRRGLVNGLIIGVFCCSLVHCCLGCLCWGIAGFQRCFVVHWCIACLVACVGKSQDSNGDWWRFGVLRGRRRGLVNGLILGVFCSSLVHRFLGCLCQSVGRPLGRCKHLGMRAPQSGRHKRARTSVGGGMGGATGGCAVGRRVSRVNMTGNFPAHHQCAGK